MNPPPLVRSDDAPQFSSLPFANPVNTHVADQGPYAFFTDQPHYSINSFFWPSYNNDPDETKETSSSSTSDKTPSVSVFVFSCVHVLLTLFFFSLVVYTLISVKRKLSSEIFTECAQELWTLLILHITMPFLLGILLSSLSFCCLNSMSPYLLHCTHTNTFGLVALPTLTILAYSCTMLALGLQAISHHQSETCISALSEPTEAMSPHVPLLIVLSWIFVGIDSLALMIEVCFLIFILGIQLHTAPLK